MNQYLHKIALSDVFLWLNPKCIYSTICFIIYSSTAPVTQLTSMSCISNHFQLILILFHRSPICQVWARRHKDKIWHFVGMLWDKMLQQFCWNNFYWWLQMQTTAAQAVGSYISIHYQVFVGQQEIWTYDSLLVSQLDCTTHLSAVCVIVKVTKQYLIFTQHNFKVYIHNTLKISPFYKSL